MITPIMVVFHAEKGGISPTCKQITFLTSVFDTMNTCNHKHMYKHPHPQCLSGWGLSSPRTLCHASPTVPTAKTDHRPKGQLAVSSSMPLRGKHSPWGVSQDLASRSGPTWMDGIFLPWSKLIGAVCVIDETDWWRRAVDQHTPHPWCSVGCFLIWHPVPRDLFTCHYVHLIYGKLCKFYYANCSRCPSLFVSHTHTNESRLMEPLHTFKWSIVR